MNRISLSVMLLVGIEASKEPFFVEAYKLRGDSACFFIATASVDQDRIN